VIDIAQFFVFALFAASWRAFLARDRRRDKRARYLGARDDENLSAAISWLTA
jgi:hypothetical protein